MDEGGGEEDLTLRRKPKRGISTVKAQGLEFRMFLGAPPLPGPLLH